MPNPRNKNQVKDLIRETIDEFIYIRDVDSYIQNNYATGFQYRIIYLFNYLLTYLLT